MAGLHPETHPLRISAIDRLTDDAVALTTTVYSIAPYCVSLSTTCATVDCFCPMAT